MFNSEKMAQAIGLINAFNGAVAEELHFPKDQLVTKLHTGGYTEDADLSGMAWSEWQAIGMPLGLAKKVAKVFRDPNAKDETGTTGSQTSGSTATSVLRFQSAADEAGELTHRELVERFAASPTVLYGAIAEQLRARSGQRKCIAYNADGTAVHIEATVLAIESYAQGEDPGDFVMVGKERFYLYHVGEQQGTVRDEHPVFAGESLKRDGRDKYDISWADVAHEVRQLIRLAVETEELSPHEFDRDDVLNLRDWATAGLGSIQERYPLAARQFADKKDLKALPALKIRVGSGKKADTPSAA